MHNGWAMMTGGDENSTEVERLRLAILTMGARERETAAERDALRTMLAEAREIIEGRTAAPTDAEIAAHRASGGAWLCAPLAPSGAACDPWVEDDRTIHKRRNTSARWWALDGNRCPCAWPTMRGE